MQRADAAGGELRGEARGQTRCVQRTGGGPQKGEGRANRCGRSAAGQGPSSSLIPARTPRAGEGGDRRGSAGGEPPDCVKYRRAAVASALAPTVAALSSLLRDVLRLLQLGLVRTFLSEGECGDVTGGVRPDHIF